MSDLESEWEEIDAVVKTAVKPEQYRAVYEPMFAIQADKGEKVSPQYDWRPMSTYIRRPPYWDTEGVGALAATPRTLKGMRVLALLPAAPGRTQRTQQRKEIQRPAARLRLKRNRPFPSLPCPAAPFR